MILELLKLAIQEAGHRCGRIEMLYGNGAFSYNGFNVYPSKRSAAREVVIAVWQRTDASSTIGITATIPVPESPTHRQVTDALLFDLADPTSIQLILAEVGRMCSPDLTYHARLTNAD